MYDSLKSLALLIKSTPVNEVFEPASNYVRVLMFFFFFGTTSCDPVCVYV